MHLGNGTTKRETARKAFSAYKETYSNKIDFGESSIPEGNVYRRRGVEKKSWFWIVFRILILLAILIGVLRILIESVN